ncbi:MAG TPA: hypothetical protein VI564_00975 [Candidatus Nanoarchaeia archaeon]|nr:hypothetical protein [Candidatus Nanoarchaeia archaeon]
MAKSRPGKKMESVSESGQSAEFSIKDFPNIEWDEISTKEELLVKLARLTEGYVGADIEAICREAAILALRENINSREILPRHFKQAVEKVRPSVTKDVERHYEELSEQLTAARAKQMLNDKPGYMG